MAWPVTLYQMITNPPVCLWLSQHNLCCIQHFPASQEDARSWLNLVGRETDGHQGRDLGASVTMANFDMCDQDDNVELA